VPEFVSIVESARALGLKIPPKLLTANANVG
jgi:phage-related holin